MYTVWEKIRKEELFHKRDKVHTQKHTNLLDECVIVDLDVNVDRGIRKGIKNVPEERHAFVISSFTETLCTDKDESTTVSFSLK